MKLTELEIKAYKRLANQIRFEILFGRLGYLSLLLTFLAYLFFPDLVPSCFIATCILLSHTVLATHVKQLLKYSEDQLNEDPRNIIKAANLNSFKR